MLLNRRQSVDYLSTTQQYKICCFYIISANSPFHTCKQQLIAKYVLMLFAPHPKNILLNYLLMSNIAKKV